MPGVTCAACNAHVTVRGLAKCPICQAPIKPIIDPRLAPIASHRTTSTPRHGGPGDSRAAHGRTFTEHSGPLPGKSPITDNSRGNSIFTHGIAIVGIALGVLMFGWIAKAIFSPPSEEKLHAQAVGLALEKCQRAILSTAQYGDAETPPFVANHGTKGEFYFAWPKGKFEFSNGFGARVPMSASCLGDLTTGEIKSLTINSKDVI